MLQRKINFRLKELSMKSWHRVAGAVALLVIMISTPALAEKFVVGYQPYDTISYQAIVNEELGLWKKYVPPGTQIEFEGALQGTVIANDMLAGKAQIGYRSEERRVGKECRSRWSP